MILAVVAAVIGPIGFFSVVGGIAVFLTLNQLLGAILAIQGAIICAVFLRYRGYCELLVKSLIKELKELREHSEIC